VRARWLLILLIAYLAFDLADPVLPGAFSFKVRDSLIEQAVHANRTCHDKTAIAVQPALPERSVEPRDDSFTRQRLAVTAQPPTEGSSPHPAPRSALLAPARSPDDD
jgi:hypothetical protein